MVAIGIVTKQKDGSYKGELKTLTIKTNIEIRPNLQKANDRQPDYRVYAANNVEIGTARKKVAKDNEGEYVAVALAAPEFGPKRLVASLDPAAGQGDANVFEIIWIPEE